MIISTTDRWGKNAEDALAGQMIPVQRIGMAEIAESPIDWDVAWPQGDLQVNLAPARRHAPRPHQQQAIDAVFRGYGLSNDRGKLIMACGTGKTPAFCRAGVDGRRVDVRTGVSPTLVR